MKSISWSHAVPQLRAIPPSVAGPRPALTLWRRSGEAVRIRCLVSAAGARAPAIDDAVLVERAGIAAPGSDFDVAASGGEVVEGEVRWRYLLVARPAADVSLGGEPAGVIVIDLECLELLSREWRSRPGVVGETDAVRPAEHLGIGLAETGSNGARPQEQNAERIAMQRSDGTIPGEVIMECCSGWELQAGRSDCRPSSRCAHRGEWRRNGRYRR